MEDDPDNATRRRTGRPLSFDRDEALRAAMLAFWRGGYETTSIAQLAAAMGISVPSIYTAFGDKQGLFLEAVALYAGDPEASLRAIEGAPSAIEAARAMLEDSAILFTGEGTPAGCLMASSVATGSEGAAPVRAAVAAMRGRTVDALRRRIERDVHDGLLGRETDATALADMTVAVILGMSVLARDGVRRDRLRAAASGILAAWPTVAP